MKKNKLQQTKRQTLIRTAISDHEKAAEIIRSYADRLEKSQGVTERIHIIGDLMCISEATIFREIKQ